MDQEQGKDPASFRIATGDQDLLKVMVVRGIVFVEEQQVDWEGEFDEFEQDAVHFLGEVDGQPVAAGRLRVLEDGWGKLERIAVRPGWRGQGLAKQMVAALLIEAQARGIRDLKLHAQAYLDKFYADFGFRKQGPAFIECGILHILMVREGEAG